MVECRANGSGKSVSRVPHKSVPQECPTSVPQECQARVSQKSVKQECSARVALNAIQHLLFAFLCSAGTLLLRELLKNAFGFMASIRLICFFDLFVVASRCLFRIGSKCFLRAGLGFIQT